MKSEPLGCVRCGNPTFYVENMGKQWSKTRPKKDDYYIICIKCGARNFIFNEVLK